MPISASIDAVTSSAYVLGTQYPTGLRAGNFQSEGSTVARGIGVGLTSPYSFDFAVLLEPFIVQTFSGPGYFSLTKNYSGLEVVSRGDRVVNLNVPRCIQSQSTVAHTVTVSGYEFYDRKMLTKASSVNVSGEQTAQVVRPYKGITAVYIEADTYPVTISLFANGIFDVPFTNNGDEYFSFWVTDQKGPLMYAPPATALPYGAQWSFQNDTVPSPNPALPQNATTTLLRPVFNFNHYVNDRPEIETPLTIWMISDNLGWNYDVQPFLSQTQPYPNGDIRNVIGADPYNVGWVDWQG
jgi:hypothetical protein